MSSANTDNKYKRKRLPLKVHKDQLQRLICSSLFCFWYAEEKERGRKKTHHLIPDKHSSWTSGGMVGTWPPAMRLFLFLFHIVISYSYYYHVQHVPRLKRYSPFSTMAYYMHLQHSFIYNNERYSCHSSQKTPMSEAP